MNEKKYHEPAVETDFSAFETVVRSRRSVRVFSPEPIPEAITEKCLEMALLAPSSSNLQTWQYYWVADQEKKKALAAACLDQSAAKTAQVLIVCVVKPNLWKRHSQDMLSDLNKTEGAPEIMKKYYRFVTPLVYSQGIFSIFGLIKRVLFSIIGLFKAVPRYPVNYAQLREWSVKSAALGCENLMLAFRAQGYDTCPMEGFDECRVKKILGLSWCQQHVVMIIAAGKRAEGGVYGPQIRFPSSRAIFKV